MREHRECSVISQQERNVEVSLNKGPESFSQQEIVILMHLNLSRHKQNPTKEFGDRMSSEKKGK